MSDHEKPPKHRSPGYPSIGLEACVARARVVWDRQQRHDSPAATICGYWGLSPTSGTGLTAMAAMKAFGLLESVKTAKGKAFKLTARALRIVVKEPTDPDRMAALEEAATQPKMHRELAEKYPGEVPRADAPIRSWLVLEKGFSERAATDFIAQYRASISFAKAGQSGKLPTNDPEETPGDEGGEDGGEPPAPPRPTEASR